MGDNINARKTGNTSIKHECMDIEYEGKHGNGNESKTDDASVNLEYYVIEYDDEEILSGTQEDVFNIKEAIFQSNSKVNLESSPPPLETCEVKEEDTVGIESSSDWVWGNNEYSRTSPHKILDESDHQLFTESFCKFCLFLPQQRTPLVLEEHIEKKHTGGKPFSCPNCDFSTVDKYYLKAHMQQHHDYQITGSFCKYCDFRPQQRTPHVLEEHMRIHTGDKPFSCPICNFATGSKYYLEVHMRQHTGEKPFNCEVCEFSSSRKDMLMSHMVTHTGEKSFICTECNFKCARKKGLYQHWKFHCKFDHYRCSVCDYKCRQSGDLKNHLISTHPKVISCPKCDYLGRCIEDLEKHKLTHTEGIRFPCYRCRKSFKSKDYLKNHLKKNCVIQIICEECNKSFSTKGALRKHVERDHIDISCDKCSKSFKSYNNLKEHSKNPCNIPVFCEKCSRSFTSAKYLKVHLNKVCNTP